MPALEAAIEALGILNQRDISTLRTMYNPPQVGRCCFLDRTLNFPFSIRLLDFVWRQFVFCSVNLQSKQERPTNPERSKSSITGRHPLNSSRTFIFFIGFELSRRIKCRHTLWSSSERILTLTRYLYLFHNYRKYISKPEFDPNYVKSARTFSSVWRPSYLL